MGGQENDHNGSKSFETFSLVKMFQKLLYLIVPDLSKNEVIG